MFLTSRSTLMNTTWCITWCDKVGLRIMSANVPPQLGHPYTTYICTNPCIMLFVSARWLMALTTTSLTKSRWALRGNAEVAQYLQFCEICPTLLTLSEFAFQCEKVALNTKTHFHVRREYFKAQTDDGYYEHEVQLLYLMWIQAKKEGKLLKPSSSCMLTE